MWEASDKTPSELKAVFSLLEDCPTPCLVVDASDRLLAANPAFMEFFEDFLPSDVQKLQQLQWVPLDEEGNPARNVELGMDLLLRNLQNGVNSIFCTLHMRQPVPHFRVSLAPFPELPECFFLWLEPIIENEDTAARVSEPSLVSFENRLSFLYSQLMRTENPMDAMQAVCRHLHSELQCSTVFMLQAGPNPNPATVAGEWGPDYWESAQSGFVMDAHPALLAFIGQKLIHIRDTQSVPELEHLRQWCRQHEVGSILALPVSTSGERFGVLCLMHRQLFAFSPSTVNRLEQLATDLAQWIEKTESVKKIEQCRKRVSIIQASQQALAPKSCEFFAILEFQPEKLFWEHISESCTSLLEIAEERLANLPKSLFSMLADKRQQERIHEKLHQGIPFEDVLEFQTGQGKKRFFRMHAMPGKTETRKWHLLFTDLSEIVQMRDSCRRSMALWKVVANLGERLKETEFKTQLPEVLADFGRAAEVSRAYIFENHTAENGEVLTSQWLEWVADGIVPQIENPDLQALSLTENGFSRWIQELGQRRPIFGNVIDFPISEQEFLYTQNILSIAVVPIFVDGEWWGFLGFDECRSPRLWSEPEIESLRTAAALIGNAISRERSRSESAWLEQQLQSAARRENMGKLAHGIAHQFNNLLSPILGYISVALYDLPSQSPLAADLRQVLSAAERAKELAHQLLRFGTRLEYSMQTMPARELLKSVCERFYQETRVPVQLDTASFPANAMLNVDPENFQAAIFSFLRRALPVENLETGSIRVFASIRENPDVSRKGEYAHLLLLEIPTTLNALPSRLLPDSSISGINWSSLDLVQAQEILDYLGAKTSILTKNGFTLLIQYPAAIPSEGETGISPSAEKSGKPHAVILVVEDEDAVRNFVVRALTKHGHAVMDAPDPQKALLLVKNHPDETIDLLITDVIMPHMSGKRLYQELRKTHPHLRVVYMSGYTANLLEKQGVPAEKRNFLAKPFGVSNLLRTVEEALAGE